MKLKYFVVQRLDDGKWTNCSCKYFLQGIKGALRQYDYTKLKNPHLTLRIAWSKEDMKWE